MTSDLESDYVKDQNITPTGRPITTRKKKVVNKTAKKVLKKVLKRVPGPIGTVARLSGLPRKLSNAVKNAKNLKPLKKGVGFPKATKKQMASFKKAMDLKSPALKKVYEANKKAKSKGTYMDKKKSKRAINQLNKETSKLKKVNTNKSSLKHNEVEHRINTNRDYVDNTRSNYSARARKTLPKSK